MKKNTQFSLSTRQKIRKNLINHEKLYSLAKSIHGMYCQTTSFLHPLPDYLIIGAFKSGTSSLYEYLIQHPDIEPAITKQIHFFDKYFERGLPWYKSCFPVNKIIQKKITGEATPYYLCHPLAPSRISKIIPNVKLIVLLRNPVDRAYSHYQMEFSRNQENLSFEDAIDAEDERLKGEVDKIIENSEYVSKHFPNHAYLTSGIYYNQIKHWFDYFPKNQFLFIKSEEFNENPSLIYNKVLKFLGLDPFKLTRYDKIRKQTYKLMAPKTRKKLIEFFRPYNEKLYDHLGINFGWYD